MNTKFQIQIETINWEGDSPIITKEITLEDLTKFAHLAVMINKNSGGQVWNWFGKGKGLPTTWDGNHRILDFYIVCHHMKVNFNYEVKDINLVKEFFLRFTPNGCDGIEWIKFFKVEEITDF